MIVFLLSFSKVHMQLTGKQTSLCFAYVFPFVCLFVCSSVCLFFLSSRMADFTFLLVFLAT